MFPTKPKPSFYILGLNRNQQLFRPSDWAERLAGIMAQFSDPEGCGPEAVVHGSIAASATYSPLVLPVFVPHPDPAISGTVRAVLVDARLDAVEPMAYAFLRQFAIDNHLWIIERDER